MYFSAITFFILGVIGARHLVSAFLNEEMIFIENKLQKEYGVTLVRRLANGTFSEVFEGLILKTQTPIAIKISSSADFEVTEVWFDLVGPKRECLSIPVHPNILQVFGYVEYLFSNYTIGITFSELLGPNLKHLLEQNYPNSGLPRSVVFQIALQVSEALSHLHSLLVTHHDVKLENIVLVRRHNLKEGLTRQLTQAQFKLIDLGLCQHYPTRITTESVFFTGDLEYSSPEKLNHSRPYDPFLADAYALGCTLARALIGVTTLAAIRGKVDANPSNQIAAKSMDAVYRLYRVHCLPVNEQKDPFYHLVGQLLEPEETDRMTVEEFLYLLAENET